MQSRFFQTRDGLRLHYIWHPCVDADSTSVCVLLHGFTNDAHVWDALAAQLQQSHHVLALDQRGHGDSDWDDEHKYSHWQLADDVLECLQFVHTMPGLAQADIHVAGHSLGGRVAMLALASGVDYVRSLTIIDAGPEVNPDAGERLVKDVMNLPASYRDPQTWLDSLKRIYVMADSGALKHVASFGLRISHGQFRAKTDPAFTPGIWHKNPEYRNQYKERGELSEQLWQALGTLAMPVHIVRGQASSILEASLATKMLRTLGDRAVLSVVPRAGHAVMLDNPEKSAALISDFINSTGTLRTKKELESLG